MTVDEQRRIMADVEARREAERAQNEAAGFGRKTNIELGNAGSPVDSPVRDQAPWSPPFVTAGNVSQPFKVLGPVHFDTVGTINLRASLSDALFKSRLERAVSGATPTLRQDRAFDELLNAAVARYGTSVNAVINATYRAEHNGTVFVDGLAVQFVTPTAPALPAPKTSTTRLEELDTLLKKGLISKKEYDKKRAQILNEL